MNSRTTDRLHRLLLALVLPVLMMMGSGVARAQIVVANPLEWAVLVEGNELIDGQIKSEIEGQTQTAVLQGTIAAEFTQIKNWENKYNAYLKSVDGYASSLKAATHLYNDGVRLFINLCDIRKAITNNPQGVAATFSMNNLYAETATELVTVYTTLRDAVATGGEGNMLTGAERSKTLWMIPSDTIPSRMSGGTPPKASSTVTTARSPGRRSPAGSGLPGHTRQRINQTEEMTRKNFTFLAVFLLLLISNALRAQSIDPTLAAMIVLYTEKAESTLQSQEEAMLLESTGHVWIKEEVDATADIQKEFNDYLDTFHGIIVYAAQIYGFYHETESTVFTTRLKK